MKEEIAMEGRKYSKNFREFVDAWYLYFWEYRACRHIDVLSKRVRKDCHKVTKDERHVDELTGWKKYIILPLIMWFIIEKHKVHVQRHMVELSNIMEGFTNIIAEADEGEDVSIFHEYYDKAASIYKIYERLELRLKFIWKNWW
jgi:hypothetical protein